MHFNNFVEGGVGLMKKGCQFFFTTLILLTIYVGRCCITFNFSPMFLAYLFLLNVFCFINSLYKKKSV